MVPYCEALWLQQIEAIRTVRISDDAIIGRPSSEPYASAVADASASRHTPQPVACPVETASFFSAVPMSESRACLGKRLWFRINGSKTFPHPARLSDAFAAHHRHHKHRPRLVQPIHPLLLLSILIKTVLYPLVNQRCFTMRY